MSTKLIKYGDAKKAANIATEKGLITLGIKITSQAKALADFSQGYQTGQTRDSIMYKTSIKEGGNTGGDKLTVQPKKQELYVGTAVEHAVYVEFGTRYMAAQPFLRPAVAEVMSPTIIKMLAEIQRKEMSKELKNVRI